MTLQFAGPPLALPEEAGALPSAPPSSAPPSSAPPGPLALDTHDLEAERASRAAGEERSRDDTAAAEEPSGEALRLEPGDEPDDDDEDASEGPEDGWRRLVSSSSAPDGARPAPRPRSPTPATPTRADALELVSRRSRPPSTPGLDLASEMTERYALGDYTGALRVAELLLGKDPDDLRARRCAESSREHLLALYTARLGAAAGAGAVEVGARVPEVVVPEHEIRWLGLDHRQGFLLSRLDGRASVDDLVDVSGMTRLEVLRTLVELVEMGAVRL